VVIANAASGVLSRDEVLGLGARSRATRATCSAVAFCGPSPASRVTPPVGTGPARELRASLEDRHRAPPPRLRGRTSSRSAAPIASVGGGVPAVSSRPRRPPLRLVPQRPPPRSRARCRRSPLLCSDSFRITQAQGVTGGASGEAEEVDRRGAGPREELQPRTKPTGDLPQLVRSSVPGVAHRRADRRGETRAPGPVRRRPRSSPRFAARYVHEGEGVARDDGPRARPAAVGGTRADRFGSPRRLVNGGRIVAAKQLARVADGEDRGRGPHRVTGPSSRRPRSSSIPHDEDLRHHRAETTKAEPPRSSAWSRHVGEVSRPGRRTRSPWAA
jgi:hypothetical protein